MIAFNIILPLGAIITASLMPFHVMTALFLIATTLMCFTILSMVTLGVNFYDGHSRWYTSEHILCAISCFLKGCIIALTVFTSLICCNVLSLNIPLYVLGIGMVTCAILTACCDYKIPNNYDIAKSLKISV
jgi:hypothetical protein